MQIQCVLNESVLGNVVVGNVDRGSMTPGAICSINDLPDVYTVLKACKHPLMASCKSRQEQCQLHLHWTCFRNSSERALNHCVMGSVSSAIVYVNQ